jgi:cytochrome b subunit of formate dehydrogenase
MMAEADATETQLIRRFSPWARFQHAAALTLFVVLVVTGMPQKWPYLEASQWTVNHLGGLLVVRWLHRAAGAGFAILLGAHLVVAMTGVLTRRMRFAMLLGRRDFQDARDNLKYYLGYADQPPKFGRYDYRQKFEYWGLIFGGMVMAASGFILLYPIAVSQFLPAELIPVAKVTHSYEALLALLIVIIWHLAANLLTPESFPMDTSIFTGKITREKLHREHTLEYEERFGGQ